jgi:hypothetical protein
VYRSDAFIAHVGEGVLNGLALRIQHGLLGSDDDLCFHAGYQARMLRKAGGGCQEFLGISGIQDRRGVV